MRVSLTGLIDVVNRAGPPKATKVRELALQEGTDYTPGTDLYKQFRDHVIGVHRRGGARAEVAAVLGKLNERTRSQHYPELVAGYQRWWGRKSLEWHAPISGLYEHAGVRVSVNPELGFLIEGRPTLLKMYLRQEPIGKANADLVCALMRCVLPECFAVGLFDVRRSRVYPPPQGSLTPMIAMVNAELAYIAHLRDTLKEAA